MQAALQRSVSFFSFPAGVLLGGGYLGRATGSCVSRSVSSRVFDILKVGSARGHENTSGKSNTTVLPPIATVADRVVADGYARRRSAWRCQQRSKAKPPPAEVEDCSCAGKVCAHEANLRKIHEVLFPLRVPVDVFGGACRRLVLHHRCPTRLLKRRLTSLVTSCSDNLVRVDPPA